MPQNPPAELAHQVAIREMPPADAGYRWLPEDASFIEQLRREMLPDIHPEMSRVLVRDRLPDLARKLRGSINSNDQQAYRRQNDPHIYVNAYTKNYRKAREGDEDARKALAGILAHEHAHIYDARDGAPRVERERLAYNAQLDRLRQLGASERSLRDVERARALVLRTPE